MSPSDRAETRRRILEAATETHALIQKTPGIEADTKRAVATLMMLADIAESLAIIAANMEPRSP